jgi:DNA polymerase-3 subunit gamma/tau
MMAYTVLARKYRSQTFDEVVGQDPIAKTLKNAIKTDRVAHAYLFTGTRGVGKTTMARILAKALNCLSFEQPTTEPCCKCDSCIAINAGEDIDVIEIDGATNNGVEQVRELRQNAIYRPARSRFKIYIIDEIHMLTVPAFNALLKILEEPPSHVKFIFATTEPNKVIPTIQSRCQRFDFGNINTKLIAEQLKSILDQEKIKYDEGLPLPLAKMANGSMRDALSLLDRLISTGAQPLNVELVEEFLGEPNSEKIYNLIERIGDNDAAGTLAATDDLTKTGLSEVQIVNALVDRMRDLMVIKSAGTENEFLILTVDQQKRATTLAKKFDTAALIYNITTLERLRWQVKNSDTPRALLEAVLLRFALAEHFMNIDQLLSQSQNSSNSSIKKKQVVIPKDNLGTQVQTNASKETQSENPQQIDDEPQVASNDKREVSGSEDLLYITEHWQDILAALGTQLGPGTVGLLSSATPTRLENGLLTLEFAASAKLQKQMCESNGRAEQIASALSDYLGLSSKIQLEFILTEQPVADARPKRPRTDSQRRSEIINDPAVKTILTGLDATITGIEENSSN